MIIKNYLMKNVILLLLFTLASCSVENTTQDVVDDELLVAETKNFLYGNPTYFIPPGASPEDDGSRSTYKQVCWTPSGLVGQNDRVDELFQYRLRLDRASPNNQTHYSQYQIGNDGGYPGIILNGIQQPDRLHQAGYVCYALVFDIFNNANIQCNLPLGDFNPENFLEANNFTQITQSDIRVGDVVVYDWDSNLNTYEHIGIIIERNNNNLNESTIVSSIGISYLYFSWGATRSYIDSFGRPENGGVIDWWPLTFSNTIHYYRKN